MMYENSKKESPLKRVSVLRKLFRALSLPTFPWGVYLALLTSANTVKTKQNKTRLKAESATSMTQLTVS